MHGIYNVVLGFFDNAMREIQNGMYEAGSHIFNSLFFNIAFTLSLIYIGFLIAFQKCKTEESAYKLIWLIVVFSIVKGILAQDEMYVFFINIINAPANTFLQMISSFVNGINADASLENIIETLLASLSSVHDAIYAKASIGNWLPAIYALLLNICGLFLIAAILLFSVFSIFLAKVVLSLSPFIIIFLLWRKTEYIFFNWLRLYVSLSLYPAMTILFGLVCSEVAEHLKRVSTTVNEGLFSDVLGVCIVLVLIGLGIFKIPNIINQVIGSSNEGSSMSGGLATVSSGAAIVGGVAKFTGARFATRAAHGALDIATEIGIDSFKNRKMLKK